MESPKYSLWSESIFVMMLNKGDKTFVESNLPPIPVSIIAISTLFSAKYINAMTVVISKKVAQISSDLFLIL